MRFLDRYPIVVTPNKDACRDWWTRHLGFEVGFEAKWFVWLHSGDGTASIAFMTPDHPSAPPGPEPFSGTGMCFELQVDDAEATHERIAATGANIDYPLTSEPFGQRRFGLRDPSGLWIDVVEQIEPARGYWDRYMQAEQPGGAASIDHRCRSSAETSALSAENADNEPRPGYATRL